LACWGDEARLTGGVAGFVMMVSIDLAVAGGVGSGGGGGTPTDECLDSPVEPTRGLLRDV